MNNFSHCFYLKYSFTVVKLQVESRYPTHPNQTNWIKLRSNWISIRKFFFPWVVIKASWAITHKWCDVSYCFLFPYLKASYHLLAWHINIIVNWEKYCGFTLFWEKISKIHRIIRSFDIKYRTIPFRILHKTHILRLNVIVPNDWYLSYFRALHRCISIDMSSEILIGPISCMSDSQ